MATVGVKGLKNTNQQLNSFTS